MFTKKAHSQFGTTNRENLFPFETSGISKIFSFSVEKQSAKVTEWLIEFFSEFYKWGKGYKNEILGSKKYLEHIPTDQEALWIGIEKRFWKCSSHIAEC